ncbi:hypothetical protein [Streptomyces shenzhenensis]|uniref:hypothetical protein n=1 Tax=Streptomyces shenzhenensis TaxID=943815 RepID=UPI003699364A
MDALAVGSWTLFDRTDGAPADDAVGGRTDAADDPVRRTERRAVCCAGGRGPADLELQRRVAYDHAVALGLPPDRARLLGRPRVTRV